MPCDLTKCSRRVLREAARSSVAAATGKYSLKRLATIGRDLGRRGPYGAPIQKSALARILQHTAYMGEFMWGGITYVGKYEPLITRDLFGQVQYALGFRSKPRARAHDFAFAGLLRCAACNGLLSGDLKKGKYTHYFCTGCEQRTFEEQTITLLNTLAHRSGGEWPAARRPRGVVRRDDHRRTNGRHAHAGALDGAAAPAGASV